MSPELMGDEHIDWSDFSVTDPDAPEYEAPAEVEAEAETPVDEPAPPEETAADEEAPPEDTEQEVAEPEEAPEEEDPLVAAYKAKYGNDIDAALKAAAHRDQQFGRQGNEIGELRQQLAQLTEQVQAPPPQPQQFPQVSPEEMIAAYGNSEARAADAAAEVGDWRTHNQIVQAWEAYDANGAYNYQLSKQAQHAAFQAQQHYEQLEARQRESMGTAAVESAWTRLGAEMPDLETLGPLMRDEAAAARAAGMSFSPMIESGDPEQAYYALRTLALTARSRNSGAREQEATKVARNAAVESQKAKAEALVSSTSATAPDPTPPQSYDDEFLEQLQAEDKPRADGWQISGT